MPAYLEMFESSKDRIIVALDFKDVADATWTVSSLIDHVGGFKIGLEFITSTYAWLMANPDPESAISQLRALRQLFSLIDGRLFWDGKWADIPNTIAGAASGLLPLRPAFTNIHASCGIDAMREAVSNSAGAKVLAVTILTSLEENEAHLIFGKPSKAKVIQFARDAVLAGVWGIICSAQELELIGKRQELAGLFKITPGIRPAWASTNDQKRVMTPGEAIAAGAAMLVVGRPITKPPKAISSPVEAARLIAEEIDKALPL